MHPAGLDPALLLKLVRTPMPYGKYAGRLLADLPGNYLNWFAREGFPKGELGRLLSLMQKPVCHQSQHQQEDQDTKRFLHGSPF
jgi:uncharacterized protein (DUF3820 family)